MSYQSIINTGFTQPSQAWQDYLRTRVVESDGSLSPKPNPDPLQAYYDSKGTRAPEPTTPTSSTPTGGGSSGTPDLASQLESIRRQALNIQSQIPVAFPGTGGEQSVGSLGLTLPGYEQEDPAITKYRQEQQQLLLNPVNEEDIYKRQLRLFQKEIDAANRVYDDMLKGARFEGQGRLGSAAAASARAGLLGSDFAESRDETVRGYNRDIERGIQNERQVKVQSIMGFARKAAADEIAAKNKARTESAEAYIAYVAGKSERKKEYMNSIAKALIDQGIDPNNLSDVEKQQLEEAAKQIGVSTDDILANYATYKADAEATSAETELKNAKTQAEIDKINADIASGKLIKIGEGDMLYDPVTGETFKNPKTYAPDSGADGSYLTSDNKKVLLGSGWSEEQITSLAQGVKEYGLPTVIEEEKKNGATPAEIKALETVFKAEGQGSQFITKDYLKSLYSQEALEKAAAEAGYGDMGEGLFNLKDVDTEKYLTYLEGLIGSWRQAGYSDAEILKMMQ